MGRRAKGIHHYMESKVIMGVGGWRARSVSGGGAALRPCETRLDVRRLRVTVVSR